MLTFHPVLIDRDLCRGDPLYVGNFFELKGMWWKKRKQRQGLVISIALGWYRMMKQNQGAPGFVKAETFITHLTRQVKDAKIILEAFFEIDRLGFNFSGGDKSPTIISPKKLGQSMIDAVESITNEVRFDPGSPPSERGHVVSSVKISTTKSARIIKELKSAGREDLIPAVSWLLEHDSLSFYYKPSGKLQARDTSVWPIRAIENWPGWLRAQLFGRVIDIENSYCQFIMNSLNDKYSNNPAIIKMKYPDIVRSVSDKVNFREEICREVLRLPVNDSGISAVKRLLMSLANGSNATPALMVNGSGQSDAVRIVLAANPNLQPSELLNAGKKLSFIARQFRYSKKDLCSFLLGQKSSAENVKKIFTLYFDWEREQRYKIWEAVGRTGLHLHDGIDGIQMNMSDSELQQHIVLKTSVRVSVESDELETV